MPLPDALSVPMRLSPRRIPLRLVLIVPATALLLAFAGAEWFFFDEFSKSGRQALLQARGEGLERDANERLRRLFDAPRSILAPAKDRVRLRPECLRDSEVWRAVFLGHLMGNPSIRRIYFGLQDGAYLGVSREPDDTFVYVCADAPAPGAAPLCHTYALGADGTLGPLREKDAYDARVRPWYAPALAASPMDSPVWSEVYVFASGMESGITVSQALRGPDGRPLGVIAVDNSLSQLSKALGDIAPTPNSHVCILDGDLRAPGRRSVIVSSEAGLCAPVSSDGVSALASASNCRCEEFRHAFAALRVTGDFERSPAGMQSARYESGDDTFHVASSRLADSLGRDWRIVSVIPESDLMGDMSSRERRLLIVQGTLLLVAILIAWLFALRFAARVGHLRDTVRQMSLRGAPGSGPAPMPSRVAELMDLSEDFRRLQRRIEQAFEMLESRVQERTAELVKANGELTRTASDLRLSRFILDKASSSVFLIASDGSLLYVNERASAFLGYSKEELLRMKVGDVDPEFSEEVWSRHWRDITAPGAPEFFQLQTKHRRRDGHLFPIEVFAHLVEVEGRLCQVAFASDITNRVEADRRLRLALTHADQALELTRSGYWRVPLARGDEYIGSERACALLGLPARPGWRYSLRDFYACIEAVDPRAAAEVKSRLEGACEGALPFYDATFPYRRPDDGRVVWLRDSGMVLHETNEAPTEMFGVCQDVTDIVEARRELEAARNAAEAANRLKSEFLANMSHEIRTPMNAILGYAQLMRRDASLPEPVLARVETINRAGEHLLTIINDILEMSKIEAGRITLNRGAFDLSEFLRGMVELYSVRAKSKGLSLSLSLGEGLPRLVSTDEGKLRQALGNLVANAVKFTERGSVDITAQCAPAPGETGPGAREMLLTFVVRDTGPGIGPDELANLFRPFVQASAGHRLGGTGLGLAISRQYARLLGGDITVQSEPGIGSVFTLTARVGPASEYALPPAASRARVERLSSAQPPVSVLIADDNPQNREMLGALLTPLGFQVRFARDGAEAVELFTTWRPRAVLMDMRMPVMDGYEACRRIKALAGSGQAYILAITASAFEEDKAAVFAAGADDFLRKPVGLDELLALLGQRLGLDYVYRPTSPVAKPAGPVRLGEADAAELRASLARLPVEIIRELSGAARAADYERLLELCERVAQQDAFAAEVLGGLVLAFDYDGVLKHLGGVEG